MQLGDTVQGFPYPVADMLIFSSGNSGKIEPQICQVDSSFVKKWSSLLILNDSMCSFYYEAISYVKPYKKSNRVVTSVNYQPRCSYHLLYRRRVKD